jgi:hypothetical protein
MYADGSEATSPIEPRLEERAVEYLREVWLTPAVKHAKRIAETRKTVSKLLPLVLLDTDFMPADNVIAPHHRCWHYEISSVANRL